MKIHCISCGHHVELDDDTYSRYKGPVRCWVCHSMLFATIVDGCVESVSLADVPPAQALPEAARAMWRPELPPKITKPDPGAPRPEPHHE